MGGKPGAIRLPIERRGGGGERVEWDEGEGVRIGDDGAYVEEGPRLGQRDGTGG